MCLALILLYSSYAVNGYVHPIPAVLKITPSQLVVEEERNPLPLVNVTVDNAEDLFAWQVKVYFDATVLNITKNRVTYPEDHVFSNKRFLNITPSISFDTYGFYVLFGSTLIGEEEVFSGSGTLCQLNFTGIASGISTLNLSTPLLDNTFLFDSDLNCILTAVIDNKSSGSLTLELDKTSLFTSETDRGVTMSGVLIPKKADAEIVIYYKTFGSPWLRLAWATTDSEGRYSYKWRPSRAGTYQLVTEWYGDEQTNPAISITKTFSIYTPTPSATPYLIALSWIGILAFVAYIVGKEKASKPPDSNTESGSSSSTST